MDGGRVISNTSGEGKAFGPTARMAKRCVFCLVVQLEQLAVCFLEGCNLRFIWLRSDVNLPVPSRMKTPSSLPHFRLQAGYTLMEIMLVLAIISVLVGAGIYYLTGSLDVAKEQRVDADIQTLTTQLGTYESQNLFLPTTAQGLQALVTRPGSEPQPKRWKQMMKKTPIDPWGMPYQYKNPGTKNPERFDIYSFGPDRVESGDDIGNWDK